MEWGNHLIGEVEMNKRQHRLLSLSILCMAIAISLNPFTAKNGWSQTQPNLVKKDRSTFSTTIVLDELANAQLHLSLLLSPILLDSTTTSLTEVRTASLLAFTTINDDPTLKYSISHVAPVVAIASSQPIFVQASWDNQDTSMEYQVILQPKGTLTWGKITQIDDIKITWRLMNTK